MVSWLMIKKLRGLYAINEVGEAAMRSIGQGEIVLVEVKRPRNVAFHRKLFACLSIVLDNQQYYRSIDDLLDVTKLAVGHYHTIETKEGLVKIPSSISFAAMDDVAFATFYDKVMAWVCSEVIPGLKRRDLDTEVEAQLLTFGD